MKGIKKRAKKENAKLAMHLSNLLILGDFMIGKF